MRIYSDRMIFVGHPGEHVAFCREFGSCSVSPHR